MSVIFTFDQYSHGVMVTTHNRDALHKLLSFLEDYELREIKRLPQGGTINELKKQFYGITHNKKHLFIHRNTLNKLIGYLNDKGYNANNYLFRSIAIPESESIHVLVKSKFVPRDYQTVIIDHLCRPIYSSRVDLQTGGGKFQDLNAKIRIPGGWSTMGEMKVGTEVVAPDGTTTEVTGVYPQGKQTVFKVTFADGRSTEAGGEHLWKVSGSIDSSVGDWSVLTTEEIIKWMNYPKTHFYVPLIQSEVIPDSDLIIPPYHLGKILGSHKNTGDGNLGQHYVGQLRQLELLGKIERERFIPDVYLNASHQQRLQLVQGLFDVLSIQTHDSGDIVVGIIGEPLAKDIQYLIRSLGGVATLSFGVSQYQLSIRHPDPKQLVTNPYLQAQVSSQDVFKLRIKSIECIGEKETQCISVAHPDRLYITDDFIVTHNTFSTLAAVKEIAKRTVIMIPPKYFGLWVTALKDVYEDIDNRFVTVSGSSELQVLIHQALEGELNYDFIIMSMVTYRNYIEYFERFGDNIVNTPYRVSPCQFHEIIKAGIQINDEIQEDPGLVFRIDVFTNVAKQIYLSATPYTGNDFVTRMIDHMLPDETKVPLPELDVFVNVNAILYGDPGIQPNDYIVPFKKTFNHARYEKRMLRKPNRLARYYSMVKRITYGIFVKDKQPKQKLLILCATVVFIEQLTAMLRREYPNLKVMSYVSGSDYNKVLVSDIIVSTIKSSGTGVDIPNLKETLLLQFTDSKKDNIQILGRLRRLKDYPDVTPRMTYMVCTNVPASVKYHSNKKHHFGGRVLNHRLMRI